MSQPGTSGGASPLIFDPNAPGFDANPHPLYARLREEAPVYFWPAAGGYLVSRFHDAATLMRDPRFTLDPAAVGRPTREQRLPPELRSGAEKGLFSLSPRDHARVRRAVSPAFTPRALERLRPDLQRIVDELLAPWDGRDELDIARIAERIPLRVIASALRIPPEYEEAFWSFGQAFIRTLDPRVTPQKLAELFAPVPAGMALLRSIIAERRKCPGDDLLSTLLRAGETGDPLSDEELVSLVVALISAGSETTLHCISFSVLDLLRAPEWLQPIREDAALLRGAIEEVLRWDNFHKTGLPRYALEDVELAGTPIKRGEMVMALLAAALRDPRAYPDADRFDPRREPDERIHFGSGPHYCLGANLARLECEVALSTLLRRFPHLRLAGEPVFGQHPYIRHIQSLRVAVSPPPRQPAGGAPSRS